MFRSFQFFIETCSKSEQRPYVQRLRIEKSIKDFKNFNYLSFHRTKRQETAN